MSESDELARRLSSVESAVARLDAISAVSILISKVERDLRDLSAAICVAKFSSQDEIGYVPKKGVEHGERHVMPGYRERWFTPGTTDHAERVEALQNLAHISDHLEDAHRLAMEATDDMSSERVFEITHYLRRFQRDVRSRLVNADGYRGRIWDWSLNELSFCVRSMYIASCETTSYIENNYFLDGGDRIPVPDRGW